MAIKTKQELAASLAQSAKHIQQVRQRNEALKVAETAVEPTAGRTTPIEIIKR